MVKKPSKHTLLLSELKGVAPVAGPPNLELLNRRERQLKEDGRSIALKLGAVRILRKFLKQVELNKGKSECWEWSAHRGAGGYGKLQGTRSGIKIPAHRLSYMVFHGVDPYPFFVCHKCDNPPCFNPDHLFLGTIYDNIADMAAKGRFGTLKGGKSSNASLSDDQVREICSEVKEWKFGQQAELARRYGVSDGVIGGALHGNSYRDAAGDRSAYKRPDTYRKTDFTLNGETKKLDEWSSIYSVSKSTMRRRIYAGWTTEKAITSPVIPRVYKKMKLTHNNKTQSIPEWSKEIGISDGAIRQRLKHGWTLQEALTK